MEGKIMARRAMKKNNDRMIDEGIFERAREKMRRR